VRLEWKWLNVVVFNFIDFVFRSWYNQYDFDLKTLFSEINRSVSDSDFSFFLWLCLDNAT